MSLFLIHTSCLDWVAVLVVDLRGEGNIGTGRAPLLNSLKQFREPHPQSVVPEHINTVSSIWSKRLMTPISYTETALVWYEMPQEAVE